jgi:flagellar motor protein MotB
LAAVRDQLRGVAAQLAQTREEKDSSNQRVQALTASMQRRGSVSITPNNSLLRTLPAINLPDVHVRRDGDVIRVELTGSRLFESGSARLQPGATELITSAAAQLLASYPDQIMGVEGHTDTDPVTGRQWRNNHELSVTRAMAVYDVLVSRTRCRAEQLFVVGHGPNHPVVSNATPEGKKRNRRVELVVYPETRG